MASLPKNISPKTKAKPVDPKGKLFTFLCRLCSNELDAAIQQSIRMAVSELFAGLEKTDDWQRPDFSMSINLLESNQEWVGRKVCNGILQQLKASQEEELKSDAASKAPEKALNNSSLSLVSKNDFEDWLVAKTAVKFLERELSAELMAITQILSHISDNQFEHKSCLFGPEKILVEFKTVIDTLELPQSTQTIIYKATSRSLLTDLGDIYSQIKQSAQNVGLVLDASSSPKAQVTRQPRPLSGNAESAVSQTANSDVSHEQSKHYGEQGAGNLSAPQNQREHRSGRIRTLNALTRLKAVQSSGGKLGAVNDSLDKVQGLSDTNKPEFKNASQLISAISDLQSSQDVEAVNHEQGLRRWLDNNLGASSVKAGAIGQQESELIEVTDQFFKVIIDKIGVSGILENCLEKLKLTILKIVLKDDAFFSDAEHPARQMLNKLALLATGDGSANKRMEGLLGQFIDEVVHKYDHDETAIGVIVGKLDKLIERQETAFARNSDRIARTYEGKQKIADARFKVVRDLDSRLAGKAVPLVLIDLLDEAGWRELLALSVLREGHGSENYNEALKVVDQLMNWLSIDAEAIDDQNSDLELEKELEVESLLEMISKELSVVGSVHLNEVVSRLRDRLYKKSEPILVRVKNYQWKYDKSEKDLQNLQPLDPEIAKKSHWHKRITSMKAGDWLALKDKEGRSRNLRLAWSGSESFRFVFVDKQGMKEEELALAELVDAFKSNQANFVDSDEAPLVDQGLHQLVQSVYEDLSDDSCSDQLTGVLNRQAFVRALDQSIATALSHKQSATLFYIDLDKFTLINTKYGHQAGDSILKHVAGLLKKIQDQNVYCGRLGGNEFGLIVPNCNVELAEGLANNICKDIASESLIWEENTIKCTASVGVVPIDLETDSSDSVMRKAGHACSSAKEQGHDRFIIYREQDKDQRRRDEMLQWVQRLDGSLDELLTLRCQEIRPIEQTGASSSHYEILLGVCHEGQVLPPAMLIEAAEHFGIMAKVDRWVVHNAIRWMEENPSIVKNVHGFSINLSGNSLNDETFLDFVLGELAATEVHPSTICFEVTETAAISNLGDATEFIRVLKQAGCKFSLDDFGSGLSSYAYIQKLPVDFIKIDGMFVRNLATNMEDQALVRSINELAHFMGIKTVAEYVENHEILAVLKEIGVDHSQGYGIKKPGLLADLSL